MILQLKVYQILIIQNGGSYQFRDIRKGEEYLEIILDNGEKLEARLFPETSKNAVNELKKINKHWIENVSNDERAELRCAFSNRKLVGQNHRDLQRTFVLCAQHD